jgi:hypothetical protein
VKPPTPLRGGGENQATTNILALEQSSPIQEHNLTPPSHPLIHKVNFQGQELYLSTPTDGTSHVETRSKIERHRVPRTQVRLESLLFFRNAIVTIASAKALSNRSITLKDGNGLPFQLSSSYSGPYPITIRMKIEVEFY